jgi:hypothetical protein
MLAGIFDTIDRHRETPFGEIAFQKAVDLLDAGEEESFADRRLALQ